MKALFIFLIGLLTHGTIAIAQEAAGYMDPTYIADAGLWQRFVDAAPDWLIAGMPIMISLMIACRALSEALWIVAKKTKTDADDKVAGVLGKVAEVLAKVFGNIGIGLPKTQVMEKAEKIAIKEVSDGKTQLGDSNPKTSGAA